MQPPTPDPPPVARRTLVAWNPQAGKAQLAESAYALFQSDPEVELEKTDSPAHLEALARRAAAQRYDRLIVAGGDGTVNAAVNSIMQFPLEQRPQLAILPIGTANDFAFTLSIPDDPLRAAQTCLSQCIRKIDVVSSQNGTGQRFFINIASGGNSDEVTRCLTDDLKQRWGALCYLRGALQVLGNLASYRVTVQLTPDTPPSEVDVWSILIANGRTNAGRLPVAPLANPEDGLLDVILIRDGTATDLVGLTARFLMQDYLHSEQVIFRQVPSLTLHCQRPLPFSFDGEAKDEAPTQFAIVPAALEVVVGSTYLPSLAQQNDETTQAKTFLA